MTSFADNQKIGRAFYNRAATPSTGYFEDEVLGIPNTQEFVYQLGTASTALASGVFYASSLASGTITGTGPLVSAGVATFDVPRAVRITASSNMSTVTFTIRGTDFWGASQSVAILGPSGNTFGNAGSYVDTLTTFKTITTASMTGPATGPLGIGTSDRFGLPYYILNAGKVTSVCFDGNNTPTAAGVNTITAGLASGTAPTATTADVRGTVTLSTISISNGSKYLTISFITPNTGVSAASDTQTNTYGQVPFSVA